MNSLLQRTAGFGSPFEATPLKLRTVFIDGVEIVDKHTKKLIFARCGRPPTLQSAGTHCFYKIKPYDKNPSDENVPLTYALKQKEDGTIDATFYRPCTVVTESSDKRYFGIFYNGDLKNVMIPKWKRFDNGKKLPTVVTVERLAKCPVFQYFLQVTLNILAPCHTLFNLPGLLFDTNLY